MPCRAVSCRVVLCRAVPCRAVPYPKKCASALVQLRVRLGFIRSYWQSRCSKLNLKMHALYSISPPKTASSGLAWRGIWFYKSNSSQSYRTGRGACLVWYDLVEPSEKLVLYGRAVPNQPELTWYGTKRHGTKRHGTKRHGTKRHGTARHGTARHGTAQDGTTQNGTAQNGTTQNGTTQNGTARNGTKRHKTVRNGTKRYETAQHVTVRHGGARRIKQP